MYKSTAALLMLGLVMSFTAFASAKPHGDKPIKGKVTSTGADAADKNVTDIVISAGGKKNPHDVTVKADASASITKDGKAATLSDVTPGSRVSVTVSNDGKVTAIAIHTRHHKKAANN